MSISYSWNIHKLDCYKLQEGYQNVVYNVQGVLVSTDGQVSGVVDFAQELTFSPGGPFTRFQNLTAEQVIGWVEAAMPEEKVTALKQAADADLARKQSNQETLPPPWTGSAV